MPIWLRKFTFKKIADYYTKQNEEYTKASKQGSSTTLMDSSGNVDKEAVKQFNPGKIQYK